MPISQTVDLDHQVLHYVEEPGPGPALVMVHGNTGSHTSFLPLLAELGAETHAYALDLRGHGRSGRAPGAYQLADYGRDVAGFVRTVIGRPVIVVGHSLGGLVAVWLAAKEPDWVQSIFLEDPPLFATQLPRFAETGFYHFFSNTRAQLREHRADGGSLEAMVTSVGQSPVNDEQTMLDMAGPDKVRERAVQLHQLDPDTLDPVIDGLLLGSHDSDALLAAARCPVALLAGQWEYGAALDDDDIERAVSHLAHCSLTVFERVGHMIYEQRRDEYVRLLRAFISSTAVEKREE